MYSEDYEGAYGYDRSGDEVYSKPIKAGKRTYFIDVKATKGNNDYYITITESKRRVERDGRFTYDKHKIFLYKEDFDKFTEGLQEVIGYVRKNCLGEAEGNKNDNPGDSGTKRFTDVDFDEI